jgi:hypothetical protein
VLPDGGRVHYVRISPGTDYVTAEFEHTSSPTRFYKSRIKWNGMGWDLTLRDAVRRSLRRWRKNRSHAGAGAA